MVRFHHAALNTPDIERSAKFYREVFGFNEYLRWKHNDKQIIMLSLPSGEFLELHAVSPSASPNSYYWHISFSPDDIEVCYKKALANGAEGEKAPFDFVIDAKPQKLSVQIAWLKGLYGEPIELFKEKEILG